MAKETKDDFEPNRCLEFVFILSEMILIVAFVFCTSYDTDRPHPSTVNLFSDGKEIEFGQLYQIFMNIHAMVFVGFGFLMVFLRTHSWTAIGYTFLIGAYAVQITILLTAFWHYALVDAAFYIIPLDMPSLIVGDYGAATVLISFGVLLGKVSALQMFVFSTLEVIFYALNLAIVTGILQAVDLGGAMCVHTFGAYFGLAASFFFRPRRAIADPENRGRGGYNSQAIAMIGTFFLWIYWPSWNAGLASTSQQQRVIMNTVLAITASVVTACGLSRLVDHRLTMPVVLHATLAGGVSIGGASSVVVTAPIAVAIGSVAGIISSLGYVKLDQFFIEKVSLHDTCGIQYMHGLPGILGGLLGGLFSSLANIFFASNEELAANFPAISADGRGRSVEEQGWIQLAALGVTLAIAILGGAFAGFVSSKCCMPLNFFDDKQHFLGVIYDERFSKQKQLDRSATLRKNDSI